MTCRADSFLVFYSLGVLVYTCIQWEQLNSGYPITAWVLTFLFILISGRILLFFSYRLRLPIVIMFRLFYFLMTNIWAIVGVIFYIKTNEEESLNSIYKAIMIISIIICFLISFALRRGSLRIPYRQNTRQQLIQVQEPIRNYSIISSWIVKYNKSEKENCAVCCDEFIIKKKVAKLPLCGHFFHKHCIEEWVKVKPVCPICKADLSDFFNPK